MSRKNGKIHLNALHPSTVDERELGRAVEIRFLDLCEAWLRIRFVELVPPSHLDKAMLLWRTMQVRHSKGDFRNSQEEIQATKEVAQWTVNCNMALRGQPLKQVVWKE